MQSTVQPASAAAKHALSCLTRTRCKGSASLNHSGCLWIGHARHRRSAQRPCAASSPSSRLAFGDRPASRTHPCPPGCRRADQEPGVARGRTGHSVPRSTRRTRSGAASCTSDSRCGFPSAAQVRTRRSPPRLDGSFKVRRCTQRRSGLTARACALRAAQQPVAVPLVYAGPRATRHQVLPQV